MFANPATVCVTGQRLATNENESRFEIIGKSFADGKAESVVGEDGEISCLPNSHRAVAAAKDVKARAGLGSQAIAGARETKTAANIAAKICAKSALKKPCKRQGIDAERVGCACYMGVADVH
jgi:hypothetical protein